MSTTETAPQTPRVADEASGYLERIAAAAEHARDCDDSQRIAHRQRNALIVEALDQGVSGRAVARAAGIAHSRVLRLASMDGLD